MASPEQVAPRVIHLKHSMDHYPLCWPMTKDGPFEGTSTESKVTCPDCLAITAEWAKNNPL
jgi:hypothetical protein